MKNNFREGLLLTSIFVVISSLFFVTNTLADDSENIVCMVGTNKFGSNQTNQIKGIVSSASATGDFYWDSAEIWPTTAYVSSTSNVYYFIYLHNSAVGDSFRWDVYRPVLDPQTYLPTGELTQQGFGTLTRSTDQIWRYVAGLNVYEIEEPTGNMYIGAGPGIKDYTSTEYPGTWEITISRNGTVLTSANFTLVDDLAPRVSFVGLGDGASIKATTLVLMSCSDNLTVTKLELYAHNLTTGKSYLLQTYNGPVPQFPMYYWATADYPDGDYVLRGVAYDPYNNKGTCEIGVVVANKVSIHREIPIDKSQQVGEPINVANGNVFMQQTDFSIPFREIPLELTRTYNSQDKFICSFGYGWRSNFDITLSQYPDQSVVEEDGEGVYTIYTSSGGGTYTPSAGKYSILTKNPDGTFTLLRKQGRKLYFSSLGRLTRIEERNGNYLDITRLANGAISSVSDSAGRKLTFVSDALGKITKVTDPAGRVFKYAYDSQGNLVKLTDPLRKITVYAYDGNRNLITETDPNGHSLYFEYDSSDRAYHTYQDGGNNDLTLTHNWLNKTTIVTDSLGNATAYEYDCYGLVNKVTDAQNNIELTTWDNNFNKLSTTDKNGNTSYFTYDSYGNLLTKTDPQNSTTTFTYEPNFNLVSSVTDALGGTSTFTYDTKGNLLQTVDQTGNVTTYTYDSLGGLTQTKDANNKATSFTYDSYGNTIKVVDALNNPTIFTYNVFGKVIKETNALGYSTSFSYDLLGRLIQTTYADSSRTSSTYDAVGNLLSFTDQASNTTKYTYDTVNRLLTKTDVLGGIITNAYDTEGNLTSVTNPQTNKTQYAYDSLHRIVKTIDPLGNQILFGYDPNGNIISKTDAKNNFLSYAYDTNNRLVRTSYPNGSSVLVTYDALGRKASLSDTTGTTNYTYDAIGRLTQVIGPGINSTISYVYDKLGNRIQMTNQEGGLTNYAYDALNRVNFLTDPQGETAEYTYDAVGNLTQVNYPNAVQATHTFDKLNRITSLVNKKGSAFISSYNYTYNVSGIRTKVTFANGEYTSYTYDKLNRLLSENRLNPSKKSLYSIAYTYDALGNRLTENIAINDTRFKIADYPLNSRITYNYNADNQITNIYVNQVAGNKLALVKTVNYAYDANGNLKQQDNNHNITNYSYDFENRLTSIFSPTVNASYVYNFEGKCVSQAEGNLITNLFYDGKEVILERDSSNQKINSYVRGLNYPGGIGGIIASYNASNISTNYLYDGIGNVTNLTDANGQTTQTCIYEAFGNIINRTGTSTNSYLFQTKQICSSTGLVYFGERYYNPLIGRFVTQDPLGMVDGPNEYIYVNNNPMNLVDPWGLCVQIGLKWIKWTPIFHTGIRVVSSQYGIRSWGFNPINMNKDVYLGKTVPGKIYVNESYDFYVTISKNKNFSNRLYEVLSEKESLPPPQYDLFGLTVNNCYTWRNQQLREASAIVEEWTSERN